MLVIFVALEEGASFCSSIRPYELLPVASFNFQSPLGPRDEIRTRIESLASNTQCGSSVKNKKVGRISTHLLERLIGKYWT